MTPARGSRPQVRRGYHHGNLRDALILAAASLIEESGSEEFAMIDAARRAGVSSAAPYRHFRDREHLLEAVGEMGFYDLALRMLAIQGRHVRGSIESIIGLGQGYIEFVTSKPAFFDLMWGERGSRLLDQGSPEPSPRANGFFVLVDEVAAWCTRERLRSPDPLNLSMKLWAMAIGLSHLTINGQLDKFAPGTDPLELLATSTYSFLGGVSQGR